MIVTFYDAYKLVVMSTEQSFAQNLMNRLVYKYLYCLNESLEQLSLLCK